MASAGAFPPRASERLCRFHVTRVPCSLRPFLLVCSGDKCISCDARLCSVPQPRAGRFLRTLMCLPLCRGRWNVPAPRSFPLQWANKLRAATGCEILNSLLHMQTAGLTHRTMSRCSPPMLMSRKLQPSLTSNWDVHFRGQKAELGTIKLPLRLCPFA